MRYKRYSSAYDRFGYYYTNSLRKVLISVNFLMPITKAKKKKFLIRSILLILITKYCSLISNEVFCVTKEII